MALIRCPACHTLMSATQVAPPQREPVLLDACFKCGAIWFDKTELTRASKVAPKREPTPHESGMRCPRCKGGGPGLFEEILYGERELAFTCYRCKGVLVTGEGVDRALKLHRTGKVGPEAEPPEKRGWRTGLCERCGNDLDTSNISWCRACQNDNSVTGSSELDDRVRDGIWRVLGSLFD